MEGQGSGRRCPGHGRPVVERGVVKVGWQAHCRDPADWGSQWPHLPPRVPHPRHLNVEEVDIRHWTRDTERKSGDRIR